MWKRQISDDYVGVRIHEWKGEDVLMKSNLNGNIIIFRFNLRHYQQPVNPRQHRSLQPTQLNRKNGSALNRKDYSGIKMTVQCFIYALMESPIILISPRYSKIKNFIRWINPHTIMSLDPLFKHPFSEALFTLILNVIFIAKLPSHKKTT